MVFTGKFISASNCIKYAPQSNKPKSYSHTYARGRVPANQLPPETDDIINQPYNDPTLPVADSIAMEQWSPNDSTCWTSTSFLHVLELQFSLSSLPARNAAPKRAR